MPLQHFPPESSFVGCMDALRNLYLQTNFPKLTYIRSATVLDDGGGLTAPEAGDGLATGCSNISSGADSPPKETHEVKAEF